MGRERGGRGKGGEAEGGGYEGGGEGDGERTQEADRAPDVLVPSHL